jgi:hypothetical protein
MIVAVQGTKEFNDYNVFIRAMGVALSGMKDEDKEFILLTSMENLEAYIQEPNVVIVPWGGDITNHQTEYKTIEPVIEKDFASPYTYLSLNRHDRHHRLHLISLLLGLEIDSAGLISCMFKFIYVISHLMTETNNFTGSEGLPS